ncbi:uncharacterized protein LOC125496661 [Beta vulgaris subsp. vulgaris]|uniref:uncharacterized protein LOC125496661 n=1 Tax=Beta vulgaris subsp. vulgaris TaxID=3555 RepID=UPI002036D065|nr:uncharacterized protein LOC125496661 [Beta vulgaris subsp. vulgaris]
MFISLSAKNKLRFVDGSLVIPNKDKPEYIIAWERCNNLVISWLLANLDNIVKKSVLFFETAADIWKDLEERFGYSSITQVCALEHKLAETTQGTASVFEFYTQLKTIWDEINDAHPLPHCTCHKCTCNLTQKIRTRDQEQKLIQFMMKLNECFSTVRGNILMTQPLPKVAQAYRIIAHEERHKEVAQLYSHNESLAFSAADKRNFKPHQNNQPPIYQKSYSSNKSTNLTGNKRPSSHYYCTHCKVPGHNIERCFKIHGFPPGFKGFKDRRVAVVSHSSEYSDPGSSEIKADSITTEQFNQLLSLLQQQ